MSDFLYLIWVPACAPYLRTTWCRSLSPLPFTPVYPVWLARCSSSRRVAGSADLHTPRFGLRGLGDRRTCTRASGLGDRRNLATTPPLASQGSAAKLGGSLSTAARRSTPPPPTSPPWWPHVNNLCSCEWGRTAAPPSTTTGRHHGQCR
jgi:hypothetical protein